MDPRARTTSSAAPGNRVYEDVQPQYRWVTADKEDTLVVDLTGFKNEAEFRKEHLKIQIDNYGNLKVSGERPLGGVQWSRFQRILHLPEDSDASGIRATFDDGVLLVVVPKLVRDKAPAPQPAAAGATTEGAARKTPAPPAPAPPPAAAKDSAAAAPTRQETKLPAAVPGTAAAATTVALPSRRSEAGRSRGSTVPEKGTEQPDDDRRKAGAAADKKEAEPAADAAGRTAPPPVVPAEKATPHSRKTATAAEGVVEEEGEEETAKYGTGRVDLLQGALLTRRPRQLLVNVMVAVMVLVGLGFYFVYRYRGSQDGQEQHPPASSIRSEN